MLPMLISGNHDLTAEEIATLDQYGLVTTIAGPVAVIHGYAFDLANAQGLGFVSQIERPHPLSVYLDKSVPDIGADVVWREVKDPYGRNVTGAGIVIGFVDTGIDTTHPDFYFPNGTTKILYVWDQTVEGRAPTGFGYGYECTSADIQAKTCPEADTFGHGTHVAGIAASSGMATGNYTGVAPSSSIIFVKSGGPVCNGESWNFNTAEILDGINYIVQRATQHGMRAVISLSLGGNIGAHDGTDPLELGLDAFVKSGTPVVVAAGNSAEDNAHVRGQLSQGSDVTLGIQLRTTVTDLQVDFWSSTKDRFDAILTAPNGENFTVPTPPGGTRSFAYNNVTAISNFTSHGNEIYLEVNSTKELPNQTWKVNLRASQIAGNGTWDAWVDTYSCIFPGAVFMPGAGYEIDPHDTIGIPGTANYVVTVGAYVTKNKWTGMNGQTIVGTAIPIGAIAPFSSQGPTRDGRIKPDVVAPGMFIASARSNAISKSPSDPDAYHRILAGTSMATPHVAGVIALMLQYLPNLRASAIPQILIENARWDANTGLPTYGSPVWGFGKADARTATGFIRLTLVTNGLPENLNVQTQIDGNRTVDFAGTTWNYVYFHKGTTHRLSLGSEIQGSTGTRYKLPSETISITRSSLEVLNYTTQYFLTVNSQFGPVNGSGWYNANETATFSAPMRVPALGIIGFLGAEYVLVYWVTDNGRVTFNSVVMDQPRTVTAVYVLTYSVQAFVVIALAFAALFVVIIVTKRRRKQ
jgi:minor extracellular serine protease Vpr